MSPDMFYQVVVVGRKKHPSRELSDYVLFWFAHSQIPCVCVSIAADWSDQYGPFGYFHATRWVRAREAWQGMLYDPL